MQTSKNKWLCHRPSFKIFNVTWNYYFRLSQRLLSGRNYRLYRPFRGRYNRSSPVGQCYILYSGRATTRSICKVTKPHGPHSIQFVSLARRRTIAKSSKPFLYLKTWCIDVPFAKTMRTIYRFRWQSVIMLQSLIKPALTNVRGQEFWSLIFVAVVFWMISHQAKLKDPRANVIVLATREILVIQIIN